MGPGQFRSCPTATTALSLSPGRAGSGLCPVLCWEGSSSWMLLGGCRQRQMQQPGCEFLPPSTQEALGMLGPLSRCSCRWKGQLCAHAGSVQMANTLLAACSCPQQPPQLPQQAAHPCPGFGFSVPLHLKLGQALTKARGRGGGWWSRRERNKIISI